MNSLCGNPTLASVPTAGRLPDKSVLAEVHFDSLLTSRQTLNTQREEMKREAGKSNNFTYWSKDGCDKGRSGPKLDPRLGSFSVQLVLPSATGAGPAALQPRAANTRKQGHGEKRLQPHWTGPVHCNCCPLKYSTTTFKAMGKNPNNCFTDDYLNQKSTFINSLLKQTQQLRGTWTASVVSVLGIWNCVTSGRLAQWDLLG